jgi:DNA polymerase-3 subunit gamma/tau
MDVLEIDAASNRGIDEIRLLRERIGLTPSAAVYTVYIIDEVHMLTTEAFNALLKTLEEPPSHAVFILATTDPQKVPATIKSRCVQFSFAKAGREELLASVSRIMKPEKITLGPEALDVILDYADGSFRDAAKLLEQISFEKGKITAEKVRSALSMVDAMTVSGFIKDVLDGNTKTALEKIELQVRNGADIRQFIQQVLAELQRRIITGAKINPVSDEVKRLGQIISGFTRAYGDTRYSPIPQLPLEIEVINIAAAYPVTMIQPVVPDGNIFKTGDSKPLKPSVTPDPGADNEPVLGLITLEKLVDCWKDIIEEVKPHNHSIAGVLRSSRPKDVAGGTVIIEAFYKFHMDKLSEPKTKEILSATLKKLFGEKARISIVLGKK